MTFNDLPDLVAMPSTATCFTVHPKVTQPPPTCSFTAIANPNPIGINAYQVLTWVQDSNGNVLISSGSSSPSTNSPATTNYTGDKGTGPTGYPGYRFFIVGRNGAGGGTFFYTAQGVNIRVVQITRQWVGGAQGYKTIGASDSTINCYHARCIGISTSGDGPGGVVVEGGTVHVAATILNDGPGDLPNDITGHLLQLNDGDWDGSRANWGGFTQYGSGDGVIPKGASKNIFFDLGASASASPYERDLIAHPAYSGLFAFGPGSACGVAVNVYAPFSLSPTALTTLTDDSGSENRENPTHVINTTYVEEGGATVSENVTSKLYYTTKACGSANPYNNTSSTGPFSPGSRTYLYNNFSYPPCTTPLTAGDTYCSEIYVPVASGGYVGPAGPTDIVGGSPAEATSCPKVVNEPFVKAYNSSVSAGSGFTDSITSTCNGGELASWNNNSGTNPISEDFGAGTQLNAIASGRITGFASAQNVPPALNNTPASLLSFSNTMNKSGGPPSPGLGGMFGNTSCQPSMLAGPTAEHQPGGYVLNATDVTSNKSIFVDGDVYINGDIKYGHTSAYSVHFSSSLVAGESCAVFNPKPSLSGYLCSPNMTLSSSPSAATPSCDITGTAQVCSNVAIKFVVAFSDPSNASQTCTYLYSTTRLFPVAIIIPNWICLPGGPPLPPFTWNVNNVPSFVLHASGNIYIDPGVTELDGMYAAEAGNGKPGRIYTCGVNNGGGNFTPMAKDNLYDNCNKQLVVYGSFQANQVNLMRTFGSLRNDAPIAPASIPGPNIHTSVSFDRYWCGGNGSDLGVHRYANSGNGQPAVLDPGGHPCNTPEFNPGGLGYILPVQPGDTCDTLGSTQLWFFPNPTGTPEYFLTESTAEPHSQVIGCVPTPASPGSIEPVYRIFDGVHGSHFYTIYPGEYNSLISSDSNLIGEGIGFSVYTSAGQGGIPTSIPVGAHQPFPPTCSNNGGGVLAIISRTCAAEVFNFSPELYLSNPAIEPPSHGALRYDAVTSLPPVL
jgi:Repeat of unknown function (DUF5648)